MISERIFTLIHLTCFLLSFTLSANEDRLMPIKEIPLILNMENLEDLPKNFRMTTPCYLAKHSNPSLPSVEGLLNLNASASGQFSANGLLQILKTIPYNRIMVIDLREESHGFINGMAVSWYGERNWHNKEKTFEEIQWDENERLQKLLRNKQVHLHDKYTFNPSSTVHVKEVYTENDLICKMGIHHVRLPLTDHVKPGDEQVDRFIELIKAYHLTHENPGYWLHFHCAAGRGRSTALIAMYDMIRNASKVSFKDILKRHALIGGKDLTVPFEVNDWRYPYHFERLEFMKNFYKYCLDNPNLEQKWSSWISKLKY